ncbi:M56 family peptidase [Paenibacillus sp. NAIST15-1]|nr:M56 family peptidase [Paenibacillus sp. NAIST15-1]
MKFVIYDETIRRITREGQLEMKMTMKLAIATIGGILLIGSMNLAAEAASSRSTSDIALKTAAAEPKAMSEGDKLEKAEQERIRKLIEKNPDDTYIVYVSGGINQRKKASTYFMGNVQPHFEKYEDYRKKASTLKEAVLQQPVDLPDGYQLMNGVIIGPFNNEYVKEIETEAKKLGKTIYSKKINWTASNGIRLEYKNGDDYITLGSRNLDSVDLKQNKQGYTYVSAAETKKKNPKLETKNLWNELNWRENGKLYYILTNAENPLTKEDLIKLAKTMVKK